MALWTVAADNPALCVNWCCSTKGPLWRVAAQREGTGSRVGDRGVGLGGLGLGARVVVAGPKLGVHRRSADTMLGLGVCTRGRGVPCCSLQQPLHLTQTVHPHIRRLLHVSTQSSISDRAVTLILKAVFHQGWLSVSDLFSCA